MEMPWRPAVPTDKDRKSTYCGYCEICPRQPQVYLYACAVTFRPAPPLLSHACYRRPLAFRKWIPAQQLAASGGATPNPNAPPPNQSKQPMTYLYLWRYAHPHTHTLPKGVIQDFEVEGGNEKSDQKCC